MDHLLQDDIQKPLKQLRNELLSDSRSKYLSALSPTVCFKYLMKEREITIECLAEKSELSDSTIRKLRSVDNFNPTKETLQKLALKGFKLSLSDAECLYNKYGYTLINSQQKSDISFCKRLKNNYFFCKPDFIHLSSQAKKEFVKKVVKLFPNVTQQILADLLNLTRETINRYFKELSIVNSGCKKTPLWQIKEN